MADDQESPEIAVIPGCQTVAVDVGITPESQTAAVNPAAAVNPTHEMFTFLKNLNGEITTRLDGLHRFILDLGNYLFTFQGIFLAVISNSSYFDCSNVWFLTLISVTSVIPILATLAIVAHQWIYMMHQHDAVLKDLEIHQVLGGEYARSYLLAKNYYSVISGRQYSYLFRYALLLIGAVIFTAFAIALSAGPYTIVCGIIGDGIFSFVASY